MEHVSGKYMVKLKSYLSVFCYAGRADKRRIIQGISSVREPLLMILD